MVELVIYVFIILAPVLKNSYLSCEQELCVGLKVFAHGFPSGGHVPEVFGW